MEHLPTKDHDHSHCMAQAMERALQVCTARGVRLTALRHRVLELIWHRGHQAVKAYDLLAHLGSGGTLAKPQTIYRALEFLVAQGLVHRVESLNAFVACPQPEGVHASQLLICTPCGRVQEFPMAEVGQALSQRAQQVGFSPVRQVVETHGVCRECLQT